MRTMSWKKLSATGKLVGSVENLAAVDGDIEIHRLEAEAAGKAVRLIADEAEEQIAAIAELERRA